MSLYRIIEKQDLLRVDYIGDNAGEIVFDKLFISEIAHPGLVYSVRGAPVLNDATMEDVVYTGLDKTANMVTSGSRFLGCCLSKVSKEFIQTLKDAPLVIAKGQANFESLEHEEIALGKVFFLLKIKCEEVANAAGAEFGDVVFFARPGLM